MIQLEHTTFFNVLPLVAIQIHKLFPRCICALYTDCIPTCCRLDADLIKSTPTILNKNIQIRRANPHHFPPPTKTFRQAWA